MNLKPIRLRAIAAGLATDFGGTYAAQFLGGFVLQAIATGKHIPPEDLVAGLGTEPVFLFLFTINGIMFSCAGAAVTALLSRPQAVLNALLFGIMTNLASLCLSAGAIDVYGMMGFLAIPPLSVLTGLLVSKSDL